MFKMNRSTVLSTWGLLRPAVLGVSMCACSHVHAEESSGGNPLVKVAESRTSIDRDARRQAAYVIGDKLKISVFELLRPSDQSGDAPHDIAASAIERVELSGVYIIQEDGNIYLPFSGAIHVAGTPLQELEQTIGASIGSKLSSSVKVAVQIVEREPVYVTGTVTKPGPYKHVPGMSILHALIMAGALDTTSGNQWQVLDLSREKERLLKSTERLSRMRVRAGLLKKESGDRIWSANSRLDGSAIVGERISEAEALQNAERTKREEQAAAIDTKLAGYRTELAIERDKLRQVEASIEGKTQRLNQVSKLRERGATTDINYFLALSELGDAKERLHETRAIIARIEHKISDGHHEKVALWINADVERKREIRDLQVAIHEEEVTKTTLGALLMQHPEGPTNVSTGQEMNVSILRRTPWGLQLSLVRENAILEPGDIVQVGPSGHGKVVSQ